MPSPASPAHLPARALKDSFGPDVPAHIGDMIEAVTADFDRAGFLAMALYGYHELELMARSRHIAAALAVYLPGDPAEGIAILQRSLPSEAEMASWTGISNFILMPHSVFVATHGLDCFEESMTLQYEITKRFTAEFSIRTFIEHDYERTMARLREWVDDPNEHVRRLVSEGTRPRLPWARRLPRFQTDPTPVVDLLERLKDDPASYVRRSVANNLNDIAKDNPQTTIDVARRWFAAPASKERRALVRHALRSLVKAGDRAALDVLGFAQTDAIRLQDFSADPIDPHIGGSVRLSVAAVNTCDAPVRVLVDFAIDFVKANSGVGRKVFKGAEFELDSGLSETVTKTISVRQHTTRTHYPGMHRVTALVNGTEHELGAFELRPAE